MKKYNIMLLVVSSLLYAANIFGQTASSTWALSSTTQLTSVNAGNVIGSTESISSGSGQFGMSVFSYTTDGQKLWEGTAGWITGTEEATRYIQFNAQPANGNSLDVTSISFNYGAAGIDHNIQSNVYYSTDGWVTRTLLNPSPLDYPALAMSPFTKNVSVTIPTGTTFSIRIYPYSIVNSSPMRPTFAVHSSVVISGTTAAKKNCILQVTNLAGKWGKSIELTAKFLEVGAAGNINITNKVLQFYIDDIIVGKATTDGNGVASIAYTIPQDSVSNSMKVPQDSIAHSLRVEFVGDADYNAQTGAGKLTVVRHVSSLILTIIRSPVYNEYEVSPTLTDNDNDGKGISNQELKFYYVPQDSVNQKYIGSSTTNSSGAASIIVGVAVAGSVAGIIASFAGDANFSPQSATATIKKMTSLQITNAAGKWGKSVVLTARLQVLGTPSTSNLPNQVLKFYQDSVYINSATTNESGVASLMYTIPQDSVSSSMKVPQDSVAHTIKVEFAGNAIYDAQGITGKLMVVKHVTSLAVAPTIYIRGAQPVIVSATLTDNDQNGKGISGKTLKFYKISPGTREGDTARVYLGLGTTNSNGVASLSSIWDDIDIVHSISVTFEFDNNYNSQTGRGIFTYALTGVENKPVDLPTKFDLLQNYPNPFNPTSSIRYDIPKTGFVNISVYDILGKKIKVLVNEEKNPGHYEIIFDARELSSGIYFYTITTTEFTQSKKMILMK